MGANLLAAYYLPGNLPAFSKHPTVCRALHLNHMLGDPDISQMRAPLLRVLQFPKLRARALC